MRRGDGRNISLLNALACHSLPSPRGIKKSMTPSFASLEKICDAFSITLSQCFAQDDICVALTPAQREMLDKWNCLTSAQQAALAALMDTMIRNHAATRDDLLLIDDGER